MSDVENDIKEYNIKTAQLWKIESEILLRRYRNSKKDFEKILHDVVGKGNGILRNVRTEDFSEFSEYVRSIFPKIEKGEYDIFSVKSFSGKTPTSFVSKVCHILNPKDYPIIWDENVKKNLKIGTSKKKWEDRVSQEKQNQTGKESIEALYMIDSEIWAGLTPSKSN